ncbi:MULTISPECIES: hypothetical protein, partial [unclassified Myxococcus]
MRTRIPYLTLLVPVLALAQSRARAPTGGEPAPGPSTWLWVLLLVVAAAVCAWVATRLVGRKGPPTSGSGGIG